MIFFSVLYIILLMGNDVKTQLRSSVLRTGKPAGGKGQMLIANMAAKPTAIGQY